MWNLVIFNFNLPNTVCCLPALILQISAKAKRTCVCVQINFFSMFSAGAECNNISIGVDE